MDEKEWGSWVSQYEAHPSEHNWNKLSKVLTGYNHPAAPVLSNNHFAAAGYQAYLHHVLGYSPDQARQAAQNAHHVLSSGERPSGKFVSYLHKLGTADVGRKVADLTSFPSVSPDRRLA